MKSCSTCPEDYILNKKIRLYKSNNGYEINIENKNVAYFDLTVKGYYSALRLFKETLEYETAEALK